MKLIYTIFIALFIASCASSEEKKLNDYMLGSWQTEYMKIEMPTVNKTDSLSIYEDDFSKPKSGRAQSTYKKDGTFTAWFALHDGKKTGITDGKWKTKNDSLCIHYFYLGKQVNACYLITKTPEGFEGKSIYDWDNDGEFDDVLFMKSKRIDLK